MNFNAVLFKFEKNFTSAIIEYNLKANFCLCKRHVFCTKTSFEFNIRLVKKFVKGCELYSFWKRTSNRQLKQLFKKIWRTILEKLCVCHRFLNSWKNQIIANSWSIKYFNHIAFKCRYVGSDTLFIKHKIITIDWYWPDALTIENFI